MSDRRWEQRGRKVGSTRYIFRYLILFVRSIGKKCWFSIKAFPAAWTVTALLSLPFVLSKFRRGSCRSVGFRRTMDECQRVLHVGVLF